MASQHLTSTEATSGPGLFSKGLDAVNTTGQVSAAGQTAYKMYQLGSRRLPVAAAFL